jgi:hypothetical protein
VLYSLVPEYPVIGLFDHRLGSGDNPKTVVLDPMMIILHFRPIRKWALSAWHVSDRTRCRLPILVMQFSETQKRFRQWHMEAAGALELLVWGFG